MNVKGGEKNKYIPDIIMEHLHQNGITYINCLPQTSNVTVNDIIKYCKEEGRKYGKYDVNFEVLIEQAISSGYDKRYSTINEMTEERNAILNEFTISFFYVLKQLNIYNIYKYQDVIIVGIGNGLEGELLYSDIKSLVLVDIAPSSLNQAQELLPQSKIYQERADKLFSIPDNSFDTYISLRTYQSTYFDIPSSLLEARRILKDNGSIIISIACGYISENNKFTYGLYNPYNGILEHDRPNMFIDTIKQNFIKLGFRIVGMKNIQTEIFIYAENNK